jgi:hypothetical protein
MSRFAFLQHKWSPVAEAATRAEAAAHVDPRPACFCARRALERKPVYTDFEGEMGGDTAANLYPFSAGLTVLEFHSQPRNSVVSGGSFFARITPPPLNPRHARETPCP